MGQDDVIMPAAVAGDEKFSNGVDVNSDVEKLVVRQEPVLQRKLKSRHLQMIAIGMVMPQRFLPLEAYM